MAQTEERHLPELVERLGRLHRNPAGALLRLALEPRANDAAFLSGFAMFHDEPCAARGTLRYPNLLLSEEWLLGPEEALQKIGGLLKGDYVVDGRRVRASLTLSSGRRRVREYDQLSRWPEWIQTAHDFTPNANEKGQIPQAPVVAFGNPPFVSGSHAIVEWIFGRRWEQGHGTTHEHQLVMVVPDTRARITEASWIRNGSSVVIETNRPSSELELQTVIVGSGSGAGPHNRITTPAPEGTVEIPIPDGTQTVWHALVHRSGDLLGEIQLSQMQRRFEDEPARDLSVVEQAELDITTCENDEIEFKSFVKPGQASSENDLLETVVAFANTRGGRIYLGITDHREIQGRGEFYGCFGAKDSAAEFVKWITKLIADKVKPVPEITAEVFELSGEPVARVLVAEGRRKPYATMNNYIYVRKGSNDVQPDPTTELRYLFQEMSGRASYVFDSVVHHE